MEETIESQPQQEQPKYSAGGTGLDSNLAGALSYLLGFITGIVFLLIEKEDRFVRFHAMQSVIVFGAIFIAATVINIIPILGQLISVLISLGSVVLWIMLMVKAYQGEEWEVPYLGKIAREQMGKI